MPPSSPRWLDIVRHRVRGFRAPYLLVLQHHDISAAPRLAAPVTLPLPGDVDVLAPRLTIDGTAYRARMLDMSAVPRAMLADTVASAADDADAIMGALDIILHGSSVGLPGGTPSGLASRPRVRSRDATSVRQDSSNRREAEKR
jgi:hypothetical protein